MSGRQARANRRMRERIAELQDMARIAREHATWLRSEGRNDDAEEWVSWATALYRGSDPVIDGSTAHLEALARGRVWIENRIAGQIRELRAAGVSWLRIGLAMGLSDQGARKWYARHQSSVGKVTSPG